MVFFRPALAALALITLASCARRTPEDVNALEQRSLDEWVKKHVNTPVERAARQSNGMWVEVIEDGDQSIDAGRDTTVWVSLNYTSTDVSNNVFYTRDSLEALRQRTFTPYTYYIPQYLYCNKENWGNLRTGMHFALINDIVKPGGSKIKLSTGSKVTLYMPSLLAYGTTTFSDTQGYGGQYPLGASKIVIQHLEVKRITKNPLTSEEKMVERFAVERWGKAPEDSMALNLYLDTINFKPRADLLELYPNLPFEKSLGLTKDSTVLIRYIGRFLPSDEYPHGFIFDTNIPAVYDEFFNRRKNQNYPAESKTHTALSYKPANDDGETKSMISAFHRAIPEMRRGQWTRIVFPSAWGYGVRGRSKALQDQDAYDAQLMQMLAYSSMYSSGMYGNSYGYGMYGGMDYYDPYGTYNYNMMNIGQTEKDDSIVTEIAPYTPLMFEIYIEPAK
jgi:hypothetical protein